MTDFFNRDLIYNCMSSGKLLFKHEQLQRQSPGPGKSRLLNSTRSYHKLLVWKKQTRFLRRKKSGQKQRRSFKPRHASM